jgi:hypothetical protein
MRAHRRRQTRRIPAITVGQVRTLVTRAALERPADPPLPAAIRQNPGTLLERRRVTHVLTMAAGQERHPVTVFVACPLRDHLLHCYRLSGWAQQ